ncbi:MAG: SMI1/KNR4 family protein [Chloroflexi bacterium]|nr:SMI1/KNR4 family protein [Chloroflexota bacterium]
MLVDWKPLLERWSRELLASPDLEYYPLHPKAIESGWLGFPGATAEQIAHAETRLSVALPPSYRAFLAVSNGWPTTGDFIDLIFPVEDVLWLRDFDPDLITAWENADAAYGADDDLDGVQVDYRHLRHTLVVSDWGDEEILLLNPEVQTLAGEWEAWFFAGWIPGAERYESFGDLMLALHRGFSERVQVDPARIDPEGDPAQLPAKLPHLIQELEDKVQSYRQVEQFTGQLDFGYNAGVIAALDDIVRVVRQLAAQTMTPDDLWSELHVLADRAGQDSDAIQSNLDDRAKLEGLAANLQGMTDAIRAKGRAEGLRQGAAIIHWFLGDR